MKAENLKEGSYVRVVDAERLSGIKLGDIGVVVVADPKELNVQVAFAQIEFPHVTLGLYRIERITGYKAVFEEGDNVVLVRKGRIGERAVVYSRADGLDLWLEINGSHLLERWSKNDVRLLPRNKHKEETDMGVGVTSGSKKVEPKLENAAMLSFSDSVPCGVGLLVEMRVDSWINTYMLCRSANYAVTFVNLSQLRLINMEVDDDVALIVKDSKALTQQEFDQLLRKLPKDTQAHGIKILGKFNSESVLRGANNHD